MFLSWKTVLLLVVLGRWQVCNASHPKSAPKLPSCSALSSTLEPQLFPQLGSQRIKTSYGPFTVPPRDVDHGMRDFPCAPPLPCEDCMIVSMLAGLEYTDGSNADADTDMWMHHVVFQNLNRQDSMCDNIGGERFFASGNERTLIDLSSNGLNHYGYSLTSKDIIAFGLEAMNMADEEKSVVLVVTWEYMPSPPKTFQPLTPYWFDIGGCKGSDMDAEANSTFTYSSEAIEAPTSGLIAFVGGHLHDGGTHLELMRNNEPCCITRASYQADHISAISVCENLRYEKDDSFFIKAHYDTQKHIPMAFPNGELEPVMGISIAYVLESTESNRHHFGGMTIAVLVFAFIALGIILLGFVIWRKGISTNVREWVRRRCRGRRIVLDNQNSNLITDDVGQAPLLDDESEHEYTRYRDATNR